MKVPEWLPDSLTCGEPVGNILMMIKYRLVAQLEPISPDGWIGGISELRMSKVRREQDIFVVNMSNRNTTDVGQTNIVKSMQSKVGGFLGLGKTESRSTITLEKDTYQVGETIRISINCDNSDCAKNIDGFKIKLLRNIQASSLMHDGSSDDSGKNANHSKYIATYKDSAPCAKNSTMQTMMEL